MGTRWLGPEEPECCRAWASLLGHSPDAHLVKSLAQQTAAEVLTQPWATSLGKPGQGVIPF